MLQHTYSFLTCLNNITNVSLRTEGTTSVRKEAIKKQNHLPRAIPWPRLNKSLKKTYFSTTHLHNKPPKQTQVWHVNKAVESTCFLPCINLVLRLQSTPVPYIIRKYVLLSSQRDWRKNIIIKAYGM